ARQILFLDFDGATVNFNKFAEEASAGRKPLTPRPPVCPDGARTAPGRSAATAATGGRARTSRSPTGRPTARTPPRVTQLPTARDHADPGDNPLVSRIVIGGTGGQPGFDPNIGGIAQDIDVGNFKTDDMAVALLDFITGGLQLVPIQAPATARDFAVAGI